VYGFEFARRGEGEGKGRVYRFVESLTLLNQRLNTRGGKDEGKGGVKGLALL
jgi:hypothetical protein